jgi:uncharacterized membrane protein YsdA (DUF1294 family)
MLYSAMSLIAIAVYGFDKSAAEGRRWRTPEVTLHAIGLMGGWPGALFAQDVFRHKYQKTMFQLLFWTTVALNCFALWWLLALWNR